MSFLRSFSVVVPQAFLSSATAVRDLQASCASADRGALTLMHFFDTTRGSLPRNLRALLSSYLCQLAHHLEGSFAPLLNLWKEHMSGHTQPSIETMQRHLRQALETAPSRVFLVVDALDEADDLNIIPFLMSLLVLPTVSLLLSSRSEVLGREYLERRCDAPLSVNDYVVSHDIERLLDQAFAPGGALSRVVDAGTARQALSAGADGK